MRRIAVISGLIAKTIAQKEIKFEIYDFEVEDNAKSIEDSVMKQKRIQTRSMKEQMNYRSRALSKQTTLKHR